MGLVPQLSEIRFKDGESVDDFSMRITGLANSITTLGGGISETEIVNDLTVEEVTGT